MSSIKPPECQHILCSLASCWEKGASVAPLLVPLITKLSHRREPTVTSMLQTLVSAWQTSSLVLLPQNAKFIES